MQVKIENHGNPAGLSWFVTCDGIESGPFTQADALTEAGRAMAGPAQVPQYMTDNANRVALDNVADWQARHYTRTSMVRAVADVASVPVFVAERAVGAELRRLQVTRDYDEMRSITGTRDGDPVPSWY